MGCFSFSLGVASSPVAELTSAMEAMKSLLKRVASLVVRI